MLPIASRGLAVLRMHADWEVWSMSPCRERSHFGVIKGLTM